MQEQKGQSLVEFAFIFPLLLFFIFGIIYSGMLFYDYSTLSTLARSSTREAVLSQETPINGRYTELEQKYKTSARNITTSLYTPAEDFYVIQETSDNAVATTITMMLPLGSSQLMHDILPRQFSVRYYMYKENSL